MQGCQTARRLRAIQSSGAADGAADFSKGVLQGAFFAAARRGFFRAIFGRAARLFLRCARPLAGVRG
ncbi:protein of unknown function [Paraburkholderia dioscoreae]|uniref:Uncharacterized protein n=1 Tax=Paraburkholderia dioscoreae TaxID=2604047 RepID=A0A5Q4YU94_9BURK|nr:protein of unknown function [Paraburkholderia dioscoreae]